MFFGKYLVEYAPKGEKITARMIMGTAVLKLDQSVADVVEGREAHADRVEKQRHGHGFCEGDAEPVEGRNDDKGRSHPGDRQDGRKKKDEEGRE